MNDTETFLLRLVDIAGDDYITVDGPCQHCGTKVVLDVDYEDKQIVVSGNGGMRYYPHCGKPRFLCDSCHSMGRKLGSPTEIYSRVVGYLSPVARWNNGKKLEFAMRQTFDTDLTPDIPTV